MIDLRPDHCLDANARIALVSDVHLGDGGRSDLFGDKDELFLSVLRREAAAADLVVINGDAIDHLQGRKNRRIERAHARVFAGLRALSEEKPVYYVIGNHEERAQLVDSFPAFHFVGALRVGEDLCITHGHQFDLNWAHGGESPFMVHIHTFLETAFRRPIRQPFRDYDNALNRVVHRLFFFYTQALRFEGLLWRQLGRPEKHAHWRQVDNFWARGQFGDLSNLFQEAREYLQNDAPFRALVLGHSHQPGVVRVGERVYANVGSWALESATFGRVTPGAADHGKPQSRVQVFDARTGHEYQDERYRMLLGDEPLPDMADWFRRYYQGFFRYDLEAILRDYPVEQ